MAKSKVKYVTLVRKGSDGKEIKTQKTKEHAEKIVNSDSGRAWSIVKENKESE